MGFLILTHYKLICEFPCFVILKYYICQKLKQTKMNFRIIKCKDKQEVLLYRWLDADCQPIVELKSFVNSPEGQMFHSETVTFEAEEASKRFIKDFSQEAAQEFINRFVI